MNSVATSSTLESRASHDPRLAASLAFCAKLTRAAARNFYYGLKLLPEPKRSAMFTLYAYMRIVDDIADDDTSPHPSAERALQLQRWRDRTARTIDDPARADNEDHPIWPAFSWMVRTFNVPAEIFEDVIRGQQQDLRPVRFERFDQLREYCYRVAGTVGLASIHVWGYSGGAETEQLAIDRGIAFQLTNILRDLREDLARGRQYLPADEFGPTPLPDLAFRLQFQIDRAKSFYDSSAGLERRIHPDCRPTLATMTEIYRSLLRKIEADPPRVMRQRVSLSVASKLRIAWRAVRLLRGTVTPDQQA